MIEVNVCLFGFPKSGKTSFTEDIINEIFPEDYIATERKKNHQVMK